MSTARSIVIGSVGAALLAATTLAGEGSLPVRPGDTVSGVLVRCGDRQVFETELVRGERFRVDVLLDDVTAAPTLNVVTDAGLDVTHLAHVRSGGGVIVAGPFRVPESGVYRVTLSSSSAHEIAYAATPRVAKRRAQRVRLAASGRTAAVHAAAGSTLRLDVRRGAAPSVVVGFPGETPRELAPDDPMLAALAGDGLSAPSAGTYTFAIAGGRGARLRVTPPATVAPRSVAFPALPGADTVTAWYAETGWIATSGPAAPAGHDPLPAPAPAPAAPSWSASILGTVFVPAPRPAAEDASRWLGPGAGVGMPLAGAPHLAEIFDKGVASDTAGGRGYVLTVPRPGFGDVTYRVAFTVDGRPAAAPVSLLGRVSMSWTVTSGAPTHSGRWRLTLDPLRGVEVLDGSESLTDAAARTTSASARGFAVAPGAFTWPSGVLAWGRDDPRNGESVVRRETYDGTATVRVEAGATLAAATAVDVSLAR